MTMHQKMNVLIFLYMPKNGNFENKIKSSLTILLSSLVFVFFPPKEISIKIYYSNISLPWALASFYYNTSFASPTAKPIMLVDNAGLKICLLGTLNVMVTLTLFPWCKLKWSQDDSTSNHKVYRSLGQLHGPWCKLPITNVMIFVYGS
jgi:hypothetical protein